VARALIPNSTQIPDVIFDRWMAELSGAEFKVLLYIARRTYGFGKDADQISLNQLARGIRRRDGTWLDRGTGLSRSGVKAACNSLITRGLVIRSANVGKDGWESEESTYRLNLYAPLPARVGQKKAYPGRKKAHVGQGETDGRPQIAPGVGQKLAPQETDQETGQHSAAVPAELPEAEGQKADAASLVEELVGRGVGRAAAEQLARDKPAVCRRCLEYLPYAQVRTTPGAWLASAIRGEYGPPQGYLRRQAVRPVSAPDTATQGKRGRSAAGGRHAAITARLRENYGLLEKTRPDAIAAFTAYLMAEQDRARRFATRLSLRRREEYLASFDSEEHRLQVFARWLETEGGTSVSTCAPTSAGEGRRVDPPPAEVEAAYSD
jgi:phage replication O-like protein O